MKQLLLMMLTTLLVSATINAQKITGQVKDGQGKGLDKTTVNLLRAKDSSTAKFAVTADDGGFSFAGVAQGRYFVSVSHIGYAIKNSAAFDFSGADLDLPAIDMTKLESTLQGVTVTAQKPIVEVRADKMIVNVEGTINATGNDALELLRRSPGVLIDKDDNLSLAGKNGVQIFIDGKPTPLAGADLANYLKSLQAAQIESFELITNPSAKYEAAGNAGIINIRLKKNKTFGTNGTVNAGYNIGTYSKFNGGGSLNHRNSKFNAFGNYNYSRGLNVSKFVLYREQADSIFDQKNQMENENMSHNFKAGIDFFINAKSTFGAIVNGNITDGAMRSNGPMFISYEPTGQLNRILQASSNTDLKRSNMNFNLNYRYAKPGGSELNLDADYGFFNLRNNQYQPNYYTTATGAPLYSNIYRMISPTNIDIASIKGDYEQNFHKGRLGYGGKIAVVNTDNDFNRFNVINNQDVFDMDRSNKFEYKENVNAAYVNYNRAFKGFMIQGGLRAENTHSKGLSTGLKWNGNSSKYESYDSTVDRKYTDLFPSAAVTFNKNPMSMFSLTYSRRIDRPAYQDLNPFEFKLNDYTFMKGNTQLRPQYTNSFGVTHTFKYKLNSTLNYSHVKDIFTQLPDTTEKSKAYLTKKNLATQDIVSLNVSYPFQYKWYSFFANVNTNYSKYKADFGGGDRVVNLDVVAVSYFMQNSFKLGKGYTGELSGFYNSPSIWQGTFKMKAMYSVDGGIQKNIMKGQGTLKLAVSDIFRTLKFSGYSQFTGTYAEASGRWESRQFKVNFNYRFGNTQVKAARQRKTAAEEESKRANSGGGQPGIGN